MRESDIPERLLQSLKSLNPSEEEMQNEATWISANIAKVFVGVNLMDLEAVAARTVPGGAPRLVLPRGGPARPRRGSPPPQPTPR